MEHHEPHQSATFEGWYSRFMLPSGASIALVICTVPGAPERRHMVHFTYYGGASRVYQREQFVSDIRRICKRRGGGFEIHVPDIGSVKVSKESTTVYDLSCPEFTFHVKTTSRTPWSEGTDTPEGLLAYLPLPLHWHVHSLASECTYAISIPRSSGFELSADERSGRATVHEEKNWANSFPSAHIWIQGRSPSGAGICCAGGQTLGVEAFLLGYRSLKPENSLDFRPPFALKALGVSPFMTLNIDWESRTVLLEIQSWRQKICLKAMAPKDTFFNLAAPWPQGHRQRFMAQSFASTIEVKVFKAGWWGPWELIEKERFENASLEFGGEYYPSRGIGEKRD